MYSQRKLNEKFQQIYWELEASLNLTIDNKTIVYESISERIWTYCNFGWVKKQCTDNTEFKEKFL